MHFRREISSTEGAEIQSVTSGSPLSSEAQAISSSPAAERIMVERLIRGRQLRDRFFDPAMFADPAWDILLDLYLARLESRQTMTSSVCVAAAVPPTTALRHLGSLVERGLVIRQTSAFDQRVVYVELSETAFSRMRGYFQRFSQLLAPNINCDSIGITGHAEVRISPGAGELASTSAISNQLETLPKLSGT